MVNLDWADHEQQVDELLDQLDEERARLTYLVDYLDDNGFLPEHTFTWPDGVTYHAHDDREWGQQ